MSEILTTIQDWENARRFILHCFRITSETDFNRTNKTQILIKLRSTKITLSTVSSNPSSLDEPEQR